MDARLSGGGLIIAAEAGQAGTWSVPEERTLAPHWDGRIPGLCFLAAISFLILAARIPLHEEVFQQDLPLQIASVAEQMKAQVELLEEIEFIEEEQAAEWSTLIHALQQDSSGSDPAATWEALDQLSDRIQDATAVEADALRREVEKNEELAAALKAAMKAAEGESEQAAAARKELSDLLQKAAEQNPHLKELLATLPNYGINPNASSCLTPEEARMLAERLSQMTQEDMERMKRLLEQGLSNPGQCQRPGGDESLKKFLEEHPGCTNLALCAGITPDGGWGVNRGPGTAPISWLNDSSEEGVNFEEELLTATRINSMNSEKVGESFSAPEVDTGAAGSSGGALDGQQAADSAATQSRVLPQHRDAVGRYFKRNEGK